MRQPVSPASAASTTAWARPPSDRSCAAVISAVARAGERGCPRAAARGRGRPSAARHRGDRGSTCDQIEPSNSSWVSPSRISVSPGSRPRPVGMRRCTSSITPSTPTTGVGRIGVRAGLVVEADVAAGDRDAEGGAAVREAAHGLLELPHHARILGRTEVQAVGDGLGGGAGDGDVAERLGQRELRTGVRVERGVAARRVGGQRDTAAGLLVDADDAARRRARPARCCRARSGRTAR